jgi:hypothetical protein
MQHTLRDSTWGISTGSIQLPDTGPMHASRFNHTLNPAIAITPGTTSLDSTHPFIHPAAAIRPQRPAPQPDTHSTLRESTVSRTLHRCATLTLQRPAALALMTFTTPRERVLPPITTPSSSAHTDSPAAHTWHATCQTKFPTLHACEANTHLARLPAHVSARLSTTMPGQARPAPPNP